MIFRELHILPKEKRNIFVPHSPPLRWDFFNFFLGIKNKLFFVTRPFVRLDCHTSSSSNTAVCNRQQGPVRSALVHSTIMNHHVFSAFRPSSESVYLYITATTPFFYVCIILLLFLSSIFVHGGCWLVDVPQTAGKCVRLAGWLTTKHSNSCIREREITLTMVSGLVSLCTTAIGRDFLMKHFFSFSDVI
jgi:hypothetical protein